MAIHFRTRIRYLHHSNLKPCSYFISICRYFSKSVSESAYDPPFSPVSKLQKPKTNKTNNGNSSSYKKPTLPLQSDLPFDFFYSYSEANPSVKPISFRESPKFSPFGPGRLDRKWTGTSAPAEMEVKMNEVLEERKRILGDPLTEEEVAELVEQYQHNNCSRQINLGKGGVTHNMLDDIHNHWRRAEAVRIKCLGVPTLDMDNICFHLEFLSRISLVGRLYLDISTSFFYTVVETTIPRIDQLSLLCCGNLMHRYIQSL